MSRYTICPYCHSAPRHRIVCYYFDKIKESIPHDNILMFAGELSIITWFERNNCRYTTADLFDRASDVKVDIQNIPFPDESWDLIICNHVLEHVPDYKIALAELNRVLNRTGFLELAVPTDRNFKSVYEDSSIVKKEDRIKHFGQDDHVRIFGNDFEEVLKEAGFSVEVINGDTLPEKIVGVIAQQIMMTTAYIFAEKNSYSSRTETKAAPNTHTCVILDLIELFGNLSSRTTSSKKQQNVRQRSWQSIIARL